MLGLLIGCCTVAVGWMMFMAGRQHQHGVWLDWLRDNIRREGFVLDREMFESRPPVPGIGFGTARKDSQCNV